VSGRIDPGLQEWIIRDRLSRSIGARFFVRFHAALILAGSVAVGWLANRLLYQAGLHDMLFRHPLAILCAYGGFLLGLQIWIRYSGIRDYLNARRAQELLDARGLPPGPGIWTPRLYNSRWDLLDALVVPDGCLLVVAFVIVAAIFFAMGGYLVIYASDVMAELVFEILLAAGLIRGIRRVDLLASAGIPWLTMWAVLVCIVVSIPFGLYARTLSPPATTMGEVVRHLFR